MKSLKPALAIAAALCFAGALVCHGADKDAKVILFNGKNTTGWKLRNPKAEKTWKVVSEAKLDVNNPKLLVGGGEGGMPDSVLFRGPIDHGSDIISEKQFGDCELHIEFMVPQGANSGVYLQGEYEVQVLDSYGRPDGKLSPGDCGGIYSTKAPSTNASKAPGEWQSFDIVFRAPRFDAAGKKTENAKFVSVLFNGKKIHENVEAPKPTGGQLGPEKPLGPIMLQGDHGIVAFRNIVIKPVELK
jgi:hypothetical protein